MELQNYNPDWAQQFAKEVELIKSVLEPDEIIDIQHIGSTAILGIKSKPIIDIAILVTPDEFLHAYVRPLNKIGYEYFPESSSTERLFFRKGKLVQFHLSVTEQGKTPYWEKQIQFRDYLNSHPEIANEYEILKEKLIIEDPTAGPQYSEGKNDFVQKILKL